MSTTNPSAIVSAAVSLLSFMGTSRDDSENFIWHESNLPFEKAPVAGRDGYEVVMRSFKALYGFTGQGQKEAEFRMVVRLGHAPHGTDSNREAWRMEDIERIIDLFEAHAWPAGTQVVLSDGDEVNKTDPNWWLTEIFFKVVYIGDVRTE